MSCNIKNCNSKTSYFFKMTKKVNFGLKLEKASIKLNILKNFIQNI